MAIKLYRRREPEKTPFYRLVYHNFEEYERVYEDRYEKEYGFFRTRVREVIYKFLDCGILEHGVARIHCYDCGDDYYIGYSCKTRLFCPSCAQK